MKRNIITAIMTISTIFAGAFAASAQYGGYPSYSGMMGSTADLNRSTGVFVNGVELGGDVLYAIAAQTGVQLPRGRYWYDAKCGAWGQEGGPTIGFGQAGMRIGGPLKANASNGRTGVFINGRELPAQDVMALASLVGNNIPRGRYYLDAQGNAGYENGPYLGNLVQIAQAKSAGSSGRKGSILSGMYDPGIGGVNGGGYISGSSSATIRP